MVAKKEAAKAPAREVVEVEEEGPEGTDDEEGEDEGEDLESDDDIKLVLTGPPRFRWVDLFCRLVD